MSKAKIKTIVMGLACLYPLSSLLYAATLQGKLIKFGPLGVLSAPFVAVTLNAGDSGKIIKTEHTDTKGIYYFDRCQPGMYILKVWGEGTDKKPLDFKITISDQPITNIKPILIHSLQFIYPKEGETISTNMDIRAKGTYYNIPDDAFVWIILKNKNGNFYLPTDCPVQMKPERTWESRYIGIIENTSEILAVLVNREDNKKCRLKAKSNIWSYGSQLPKYSHIIARRKINLIASPTEPTIPTDDDNE